jgi:hypothetical protein
MDRRLIPVNAFIALTSQSATSWPTPLFDAGYRLEGLEVPAGPRDARVVIDALAFDASENRFLAAEGKSGANIEPEQARRYGDLNPGELVRLVGVTLTHPGELTVQPLFVCMDASVDRILLGMDSASCPYPVLAVGATELTLHRPEHVDVRIAAAFAQPIAVPGPPPVLIPVDDLSGDDEYDALVSAALVVVLAQGKDVVGCPDLAAQAVRYLPLFASGHRNTIVTKVTQAAQRCCARAPETFEFRPATGVRPDGMVKVIDSPEQADPRGRTQRYQAVRVRLGGRAATVDTTTQISLFDETDLIEELDRADTGVSDLEPITEEEP